MGKACEQRKKTDKVCSRRKRQKKHSMAEERKRKDNDMEKKRGKQKDIEKNEERKNGMDGGRYVRGGKFGMLPAGMALAMCTLAGCAVSEESGYFREGSYDPVKLEIYEAESGELQKTVEEEEMLYQFNQLFEVSGEELETGTEHYEAGMVKEAEETYHIIVYKRPVAKFGDKEPVKIFTVTLYENTDVAKMTVVDESINAFPIPEEFLTFYYEMSKEESDFYASLID